jgi:hypothetical protein
MTPLWAKPKLFSEFDKHILCALATCPIVAARRRRPRTPVADRRGAGKGLQKPVNTVVKEIPDSGEPEHSGTFVGSEETNPHFAALHSKKTF